MLSEIIESVGLGAFLLASVALVVRLTLGMIIVIRARRQDLPDIVRGLAEWFRRQGH